MGNAFHSGDPLSSQVIDQWRHRIRLSTAANYHYQMGLALAGSGDMAAAINNFRKAIELTPDHLGARYDLEQVLSATGQPLAPAERLDPAQGLRGLIQHVAALLEAGKVERARQALDEMKGMDGADPALAWTRAIVSLLTGGAEGSARPSLPQEPSVLDRLQPLRGAAMEAAQKCLQAGNPAAIDFYDLYCALVPDDVSALNGRAMGLLMARRLDELRRLFDTLPSDGDAAIIQRAVLRLCMEEGEAALAELDRLTASPPHPMAPVISAGVLLLLGRTADAAEQLQAGERAMPGNPWLQVFQAWWERQAGQPRTVKLDVNAQGIRSVLSRLPPRLSDGLRAD